ncbi:MAG: hypothetical protein R3B57_04905 [Phycisphaerales bacterium]
MNIAAFFEHWNIAENPFRGEEARDDAVFARMCLGRADSGVSAHTDFEKILGDPSRPATSIVFGEKGSGKTAIRMQIASRLAAHNKANPSAMTLLLPYDDLNGVLDTLHARFRAADGKRWSVDDTLSRLRLVDHLDAILAIGVGRIVGAIIGGAPASVIEEVGPSPAKSARRMSPGLRRDLLVLAGLYDLADENAVRLARLRRVLRLPPPASNVVWIILLAIGWAPAVALGLWWLLARPPAGLGSQALLIACGVALVVYVGLLLKRLVWDRWTLGRLASKLARQLRALPRQTSAYAASLARLSPAERRRAARVLAGSDEQRYELLARLLRVAGVFGYSGALVVLDRVDEPTLISGDADRMKAVVWPLLSNKFLQLEDVGVKMLLPIELRYALFRESSAFFQEARLDKQNLVERLTWTGPMLYDLCNARLGACLAPEAGEVSLLELFSEDVTRQDLVDALDQMRQPRDAFKFLYKCVSEHCSNVTSDQSEWRIPRLVLESVRRQESDRVQQLARGIRPA